VRVVTYRQHPKEHLRMDTPSHVEYRALDLAFDHFNGALFDGRLPRCLLTIESGRRASLGYYVPDKFTNAEGEEIAQINLNASYFAARSLLDTLSVLVREMVHHEQHTFGKAARRGYVDRDFAARMRRVGLQCSDTGIPYGKPVGEGIGHYIIANGPFHTAATDLLEQRHFRIEWMDRFLSDEGPQQVVIAPAREDLPPPEVFAESLTPELRELLGGPMLMEKLGRASSTEALSESLAGAPLSQSEVRSLLQSEVDLPGGGNALGVSVSVADIPARPPNVVIRKASANSKNRCCYQCQGECGAKVWGKPGLDLQCRRCDARFALKEHGQGGSASGSSPDEAAGAAAAAELDQAA
jgi:hypothetical protein